MTCCALVDAWEAQISSLLSEALLSGTAKAFPTVVALAHIAILANSFSCGSRGGVVRDTNSGCDADAPAAAVAIFVAFLPVA